MFWAFKRYKKYYKHLDHREHLDTFGPHTHLRVTVFSKTEASFPHTQPYNPLGARMYVSRTPAQLNPWPPRKWLAASRTAVHTFGPNTHLNHKEFATLTIYHSAGFDSACCGYPPKQIFTFTLVETIAGVTRQKKSNCIGPRKVLNSADGWKKDGH